MILVLQLLGCLALCVVYATGLGASMVAARCARRGGLRWQWLSILTGVAGFAAAFAIVFLLPDVWPIIVLTAAWYALAGDNVENNILLVWLRRRRGLRGQTVDGFWSQVSTDYYWRLERRRRAGTQGAATELEAATVPAGRGTEPEASSVPAGRGDEVMTASEPEAPEAVPENGPARHAERAK